jgi:hypothetical protein
MIGAQIVYHVKSTVMKKLFLLAWVIFPMVVFSQGKMNVGLGAGIDYGGFGGRFTVLPYEKLGMFAGVGYNLDGLGFNAGAQYKFSVDKRVRPYVIAMYGYNGVIVTEETYNGDDSETYYGPSFGFGIELKGRRNENNFWNFELLLPIRPSEFQDDIDALKAAGYTVTDPWPVAFSIGYHFGL